MMWIQSWGMVPSLLTACVAFSMIGCPGDDPTPTETEAPTPTTTEGSQETPTASPDVTATASPEATQTASPEATPTGTFPTTPSEGTPAQFTTISGTAYEFMTRELLKGATISLDEFPDIRTRTDEVGGFTLEGVPVGARVTPHIELRGYEPMWHQTFMIGAEGIEGLFFQTVPNPVYRAIALSIGVEIDPEKCQIVTTVTVPEMNEINDFNDFFSPHGLEGITCSLDPAVDPSHGPIYFTEDTLPSYDLDATTNDGGVLWVNVDPLDGRPYSLIATDSDGSHTFDQPTINCLPGRFINVSPPWGVRSYGVE